MEAKHHGPDSYTANSWLTTRTWIIWHEKPPFANLRPVWDSMDANNFDSGDAGYRSRSKFDPHGRIIRGDISKTEPTQDISWPREPILQSHLPQYFLLQFRTVSVILSISLRPDDKDFFAFITDRNHKPCGRLMLSDEKLAANQEYEFLVLSESRAASRVLKFENREEDKWDLYWVMQTKWKDGIAERKGIGQMYQTALDRAFPPGPNWKQIFFG